MTAWNGTLPSPADGQIELGADIFTIAAALHGLADPWTDWSASLAWTATGTAPAIGNGTIAAKYLQVGKFVVFAGKITMGSSTTFGSGQWLVTLPAPTYAGDPGMGVAFAQHTVATNRYVGAAIFSGTTQLQFYSTSGTTGQNVNNIFPFTWASGDSLIWQITYEAA